MAVKKKFNPNRGIADYDEVQTYLLYTIEEGGNFCFLAAFSPDRFKQLKKDGYFTFFGPGDGETKIYPAFAELAKGIEGHDFRIDEINGDREVPKERSVFTPRIRKL